MTLWYVNILRYFWIAWNWTSNRKATFWKVRRKMTFNRTAYLVTLYLPSVTPKAWLSRLRRDCHACGSKTAISRLLTPAFPFLTPGGKVWAFTALTDSFWKKIIKYINKLELMRENNDRTFAKARILEGKATGDIVILV